MKRLYVKCECHEEDHIFTAQSLGKALARLRIETMTSEEASERGKKGAKARWSKQHGNT